MAKGGLSVSQNVRNILEGTINTLGYEIWDVEYVKEGATWYLRITIDSENGIDINDCEKVHRTIDPILDEADPINDPYYLEVSSPGVERSLRTAEHFEKCIGEKIQVKLFKALEGSKSYVGVLKEKSENGIVIGCIGKSVQIPFDIISKASTVFDFD